MHAGHPRCGRGDTCVTLKREGPGPAFIACKLNFFPVSQPRWTGHASWYPLSEVRSSSSESPGRTQSSEEEPLPPGRGFIISGYTPCSNWHGWGQHNKLLLNAGSFTRSKRSRKPPCIHPQAASLSSLPIWHCLVHPQGKFLGQGLLVQRVTTKVVLVRTARFPYGGNEPPGRGFILLLELVPGGRFGARIWAKISNWIMWKTRSKSWDSVAALLKGRWLATFQALGTEVLISPSVMLCDLYFAIPLPSLFFKSLFLKSVAGK